MATIQERLDHIVESAQEIHEKLDDLLLSQNGQVHFRPTSKGITMVGLLPDRPQRGKGGYRADRLLAHFDTEFHNHCEAVSQGRPTPEKRLQSFLISDAYKHKRLMEVLQAALPTSENTQLFFVTDEIAIPTEQGKVVCDLLALNRNQHGVRPVLIELKTARAMTRLVEQLKNYEAVVQTYQTQFEQLYSALIGESVQFTAAPEKWLVWPALDITQPDNREQELIQQGIRVVQYQTTDKGFLFHIGKRPQLI